MISCDPCAFTFVGFSDDLELLRHTPFRFRLHDMIHTDPDHRVIGLTATNELKEPTRSLPFGLIDGQFCRFLCAALDDDCFKNNTPHARGCGLEHLIPKVERHEDDSLDLERHLPYVKARGSREIATYPLWSEE